MMLSSSAVDRVLGIQTGNHGETHRPWTPGLRPPRMRPKGLYHGQEGGRSVWSATRRARRGPGTPIHRSCLFLLRKPSSEMDKFWTRAERHGCHSFGNPGKLVASYRRKVVSPRVMTAAAIACITTSTAISAF